MGIGEVLQTACIAMCQDYLRYNSCPTRCGGRWKMGHLLLKSWANEKCLRIQDSFSKFRYGNVNEWFFMSHIKSEPCIHAFPSTVHQVLVQRKGRCICPLWWDANYAHTGSVGWQAMNTHIYFCMTPGNKRESLRVSPSLRLHVMQSYTLGTPTRKKVYLDYFGNKPCHTTGLRPKQYAKELVAQVFISHTCSPSVYLEVNRNLLPLWAVIVKLFRNASQSLVCWDHLDMIYCRLALEDDTPVWASVAMTSLFRKVKMESPTGMEKHRK